MTFTSMKVAHQIIHILFHIPQMYFHVFKMFSPCMYPLHVSWVAFTNQLKHQPIICLFCMYLYACKSLIHIGSSIHFIHKLAFWITKSSIAGLSSYQFRTIKNLLLMRSSLHGFSIILMRCIQIPTLECEFNQCINKLEVKSAKNKNATHYTIWKEHDVHYWSLYFLALFMRTFGTSHEFLLNDLDNIAIS